MDLVENVKEGLRSIKANMLRSVLTALIVAIGITSLVGILTAIDGIEYSISESLSSLGANTFDIRSKFNRGNNRDGLKEKNYSPLLLAEAQKFIDEYSYPATISLSARLTILAEIKHGSEKTNPNVNVTGVNEDYMPIKGLNIGNGRNFSRFEIQYGSKVAVIGFQLAKTLYGENKNPVGTEISFKGTQFKVIGTMVEKGELSENNFDNMVLIPIIVANQLASGQGLNYRLTVGIQDPEQMDYAMGEATGLMRKIRDDDVGNENSFDLEKSESLAQNLESITSGLRFGGFGVGFITLLGASIALMNIMLVSVTERTREVGVRKALGATPLRIRQQFVIEAIVVCVLGGIGGIILGILIGNLISRAIGIDTFVVPWLWMMVGMGICIMVGLFSGWYPASKASKLDPIESLRFE
ncbi:MAG: ABC transporter permease [Cytophagales bacterium]|jgi:putative ABC transport system permease protein|nr:ABC transporter permease [Cytophagales bacterium]MCA6366504.1 ABC transporter permease [Cytophagales bacterium]MCA6372628.1 ABC transporter permease [Cytophagales bacterium]MCA6376844.1 ABC transporter permease [Cytophagales bacterium]MCA6383846.1 ABC transporter permease [Cytophagales bacterium]